MINDDNKDDSMEFCVSVEFTGQRVDKYLASQCEGLSRARIQSFISGNTVMINNQVLDNASLKVVEGDVLSLTIPPVRVAEPQPEELPINVVYEDNDLLLINKTIGMVVHPGAGNWSGTLVNALLHHCGDSLSGIGGVARPGIVHRLDKETSGLMLVAKNDHAHQHLSAQLAERSLTRVYHALVLGGITPPKGTISRPIGRHRHHRTKMSVMSNKPRDASTHYHVMKEYGDAFALVECRLQTGRTHQIRVHMEDFGHPLIGDPLYGGQPTKIQGRMRKQGYEPEEIEGVLSMKTQMLHAKEIAFVHPRTEERLSFSTEYPNSFSHILNIIEK